MKLLLLACAGGAIGAGLRHLSNQVAVQVIGISVAWATLFVNVIGSFLMGLIVAYILHRLPGTVALRIFLATGMLGGFTTFSAFSLDVVTMAEQGHVGSALFYALASVVLSVAACAMAIGLGRNVWA